MNGIAQAEKLILDTEERGEIDGRCGDIRRDMGLRGTELVAAYRRGYERGEKARIAASKGASDARS